jgi:ABC-type uncharacterized transport system permease subunit
VTFYGVPTEISKATATLSTAVGLSGVMAFLVQMFFSHRVWVLTRNPLLAGIAYLLSTSRLGFSLAATGEAFALGDFSVFEVKFQWGTVTTLAVGAGADVFIALTLCWSLMHSKTGIASCVPTLSLLRILDELILLQDGQDSGQDRRACC